MLLRFLKVQESEPFVLSQLQRTSSHSSVRNSSVDSSLGDSISIPLLF